MYLNDVFTVTVNLAGLPAIAGSVRDHRRTACRSGFQIIGKAFDEATVLRARPRGRNGRRVLHGETPSIGGGRHERRTHSQADPRA